MAWTNYRIALVCVFVLFIGSNIFLLTSLPGLMGDEGSEGQNVFELVTSDHIVVTGERSYIGPMIDYLRVPVVRVFGYTTLGIRVPMVLFSVLTFWLVAYVLRALFGEEASLYGLVFFCFSPIYLTQQRLGWAITLFPFFSALLAYLSLRNTSTRLLLFGLVAGLGLSNHIMFLGTLVGIVGVILAGELRHPKRIVQWWPAVIGFWAGFAMQFMVLLRFTEDQGDAAANGSLVWDRLHALPSLLPQIISGSSYAASYTGSEFSPFFMSSLTIIIVLLAICSLGLFKKQKAILLLWLGLCIQGAILLYMMDRFTLRYFAMPVLWLWLLSGMGIGFLVSLLPDTKKEFWKLYGAVVIAIVLVLFSVVKIVAPYVKTGGSTAEFSLGNRTDSAAALVAIDPLLQCVVSQVVYSDNIHIYNRLEFLSHSNKAIMLVGDSQKKKAQWIIRYRLSKDEGSSREGELCPQLNHFRVLPYNR